MRGRRPEPDAVKRQKAAVRSARHRTTNASEPAAQATAGIDPPAWLKADGRRIWYRLAPTLRLAKLLTAADAETFARYCRNFARWLKMQKVLDQEGETYETETYGAADAAEGDAPAPQRANKLKRAHPAFLIADRLERMLLAVEDRFGLNPAERQRIFVARSQTGVTGDLFAGAGGDRRADDPATQPAEAAQPVAAPIGFLN